MPPKKESAKERAAAKEAEKSAADAKAKEDASWEDDAPKKGKGKKAAEKGESKEEAAAKKAEKKALIEAEEAELAKLSGKGGKKAKDDGPKKVTAHERLVKAEAKEKAKTVEEESSKLKAKKIVSEREYAAMVDRENRNLIVSDEIEARGIDAAISALAIEEPKEDEKWTKRQKAMYNDFYEHQLPIVKADKPGLKLNQYKNMIFEMWAKHPDNPRNAEK